MSWRMSNMAMEKALPATSKLLLIVLGSYASKNGEGIWASYQSLADDTGLSRSSVKRLMKGFEEDGLIRHVGEQPCANGKTNVWDLIVEKIESLPDVEDVRRKRVVRMNPVQDEPGSPQPGKTGHHEPPRRVTMNPKPVIQPEKKPKTLVGSADDATEIPDFPDIPAKPEAKPKKAKAPSAVPKARKIDYPPEFETLWLSIPRLLRERSDKQASFKQWQGAVATWGNERVAKAVTRRVTAKDASREGYKWVKAVERLLNGQLESLIEALDESEKNGPVKRWNSELGAYV